MKRPSFQFYTADWQGNSNLKRCTHEEKGIWMDILCLMHDQEEYGILRWNLKEIAQAVGASFSKIKALVTKGVLKGSDAGCEDYIYTPRSGRKDGIPVILIPKQDGSIWYSSRMVRDEYVRTIRGESSRFSEAPKSSPKPPKGDGSTTSSSSTKKERGEQVDRSVGASRFTLAALPEDFKFFCLKERPDLNPETVWKKFVIHWQSKTSTDWFSTWQKWVIDERSTGGSAKPDEPENPRLAMWIKHHKNGFPLEEFAMNEIAKIYGENWRETV